MRRELRCIQCGMKLQDSNHVICKKCRERGIQNNHKRYERRLKNRECVSCGKPIGNHRSKNLCLDCHRKLLKHKRTTNNNHKIEAIKILGGECAMCGLKTNIVDVYDFHHKDPKEKEFQVGLHKVSGRKWNELKGELKKCVLLCANCHRRVHYYWRLKRTIV